MSQEQEIKVPESSTKPRGDVHRLRYGKYEFSIPTIAFSMMLIGILLPTTFFSFHLKDPSPRELLIAICMALFSAVVFLWILDSTSVLRFRAEWVSKSIYGAAIVSILGTSVAVYKESFSDRKYEYEGKWEIQIRNGQDLIANNELIMMYSTVSDTYCGFANFIPERPGGLKANWLKVNEFDHKSGRINITCVSEKGDENIIEMNLKMERNGKSFRSSTQTDSSKDKILSLSLSRPKF